MIVLILFENTVAVVTGGELFASGWIGLVATALLLVVLVLWSNLTRLSLKEIGVTKDHIVFASACGIAAACIAAGAVLGLLMWGPGVGGTVRYTPFSSMTVGTIIARATIWMPLTTALPEEFAFRGVLLGLLRRRLRPLTAAVVAAIPFGLWHGLTVFHTVGNTSLAHTTFGWILGSAGGFLAVFVGGLLFAFLRLKTGNLIASFFAHWGFNAAILVGLYVTTPHP
jgi:tRNA pseudouridine32 synthase/23S rRNA pseudouridine746 synthase